MTTVVDPGGTPVLVYNRSGTTIVEVVGGSTPTPIPHVSCWTVALVTNTVGNDKVELPSNAEIGDVVEVYPIAGGPDGEVALPSGDSFFTYGGSSSLPPEAGVIFRKVTSTKWAAIRS